MKVPFFPFINLASISFTGILSCPVNVNCISISHNSSILSSTSMSLFSNIFLGRFVQFIKLFPVNLQSTEVIEQYSSFFFLMTLLLELYAFLIVPPMATWLKSVNFKSEAFLRSFEPILQSNSRIISRTFELNVLIAVHHQKQTYKSHHFFFGFLMFNIR